MRTLTRIIGCYVCRCDESCDTLWSRQITASNPCLPPAVTSRWHRDTPRLATDIVWIPAGSSNPVNHLSLHSRSTSTTQKNPFLPRDGQTSSYCPVLMSPLLLTIVMHIRIARCLEAVDFTGDCYKFYCNKDITGICVLISHKHWKQFFLDLETIGDPLTTISWATVLNLNWHKPRALLVPLMIHQFNKCRNSDWFKKIIENNTTTKAQRNVTGALVSYAYLKWNNAPRTFEIVTLYISLNS